MNKTELVTAMAERAGLTKKDAEKALNAFTDVVGSELKAKGTVQIIGFGTFGVAERPERTYFGKKSVATTVAKFKPGKKLKEAVK